MQFPNRRVSDRVDGEGCHVQDRDLFDLPEGVTEYKSEGRNATLPVSDLFLSVKRMNSEEDKVLGERHCHPTTYGSECGVSEFHFGFCPLGSGNKT